MRHDKRDIRKREIFDATYEVLAERGYKGTSILAVARRANASNETLYNWFGNKQGLLAAMVEANARSAAALLDDALARQTGALETLEALGPVLLVLVTGDRAIALNRAAAADVSDGGVLGRTIAAHGRNLIVGKLREVFLRSVGRGELTRDKAELAAEIYIGQLVGDVQIRRVIGVQPPLTTDEIDRRTTRAVETVRKAVFDLARPG